MNKMVAVNSSDITECSHNDKPSTVCLLLHCRPFKLPILQVKLANMANTSYIELYAQTTICISELKARQKLNTSVTSSLQKHLSTNKAIQYHCLCSGNER